MTDPKKELHVPTRDEVDAALFSEGGEVAQQVLERRRAEKEPGTGPAADGSSATETTEPAQDEFDFRDPDSNFGHYEEDDE
jgi:hypothetical protein